MRRLAAAVIVLAVGLALGSADLSAQSKTSVKGDFRKVSELVELPEFLPGLGVLHVDPSTLPAGPFLAYDRGGKLVSTLYMIPLDDLNARKNFHALAAAERRVDHVDIAFNAGHPGVAEPHYHVILWHVTEERARALR